MKKICALIITLLLAVSFTACGGGTNNNETESGNKEITGTIIDVTDTSETTEPQAPEGETLPEEVLKSELTDNGAYKIVDGVYLTAIEPYSGKYVEDGTDDKLKDIMSVTLMNTTDTSYQLLEFTLSLPQGNYSFSVKSLFAHSKITVLEKNRNYMTKNFDGLSTEVTQYITFDEPPTVHLDELEITFAEGIINVKNKTDKTLKDVYVYYKGFTEDYFFGGITYRVSAGDIEPDQIVQTVANKFSADTMRIVFATFNEA